jgi:hypothetical protein
VESANATMPASGTGQVDRALGLQPLGIAGEAAHFTMEPLGGGGAPTSVTLFDQGLVQVLEAAVTGLEPMHRYLLVLSDRSDGGGTLQPLQGFMTNPAGSAVVNAIGPIRQIVRGEAGAPRRYLAIVPDPMAPLARPVQIQAP